MEVYIQMFRSKGSRDAYSMFEKDKESYYQFFMNDLKRAVEFARKYNKNIIELYIYPYEIGLLRENEKIFRDIKNLLKDFNLILHTEPGITYLPEKDLRTSYELARRFLKDHLEFAKRIGANKVVIHAGFWKENVDEMMDYYVRLFKEMKDFARDIDYSGKIVVEVVGKYAKPKIAKELSEKTGLQIVYDLRWLGGDGWRNIKDSIDHIHFHFVEGWKDVIEEIKREGVDVMLEVLGSNPEKALKELEAFLESL